MTQRTSEDARNRILERVRRTGILRPRDVEAMGLPREHVRRLWQRGVLVRIGRGLYALPGDTVAAGQTFAQVTARVPNAVICLISALSFHGVTTQVSDRVWIALGHKARKPTLDYPRIELIRMSGDGLTYGIESHRVGGVEVRVFSPAKTVADCFKYRNKVGLDVALEALRETLSSRRATVDGLWEAAGVCRVTNVMRPYLEAIA